MNEKYVEKYLSQSLSDLQLTYVDLYLVHHPVGLVHGEGPLPRDDKGNILVDMSTDHAAIWKVNFDHSLLISLLPYNNRPIQFFFLISPFNLFLTKFVRFI